MSGRQQLKLSRRQEREGMARFGGVTNPRSGARWDRKNDGRTGEELVEFKRTGKLVITLKAVDLRDLERHAIAEGRHPVLGFELAGKRYVVLTEWDYLDRVAPRGDVPLPAISGTSVLVRSSKVPRKLRPFPSKSVLRRVPKQRTGTASEVDMQRPPPGFPRCLPGDGTVPGARTGAQREVRSLGRVLRKRATPDQETEET